jgi:hypothetical protein
MSFVKLFWKTVGHCHSRNKDYTQFTKKRAFLIAGLRLFAIAGFFISCAGVQNSLAAQKLFAEEIEVKMEEESHLLHSSSSRGGGTFQGSSHGYEGLFVEMEEAGQASLENKCKAIQFGSDYFQSAVRIYRLEKGGNGGVIWDNTSQFMYEMDRAFSFLENPRTSITLGFGVFGALIGSSFVALPTTGTVMWSVADLLGVPREGAWPGMMIAEIMLTMTPVFSRHFFEMFQDVAGYWQKKQFQSVTPNAGEKIVNSPRIYVATSPHMALKGLVGVGALLQGAFYWGLVGVAYEDYAEGIAYGMGWSLALAMAERYYTVGVRRLDRFFLRYVYDQESVNQRRNILIKQVQKTLNYLDYAGQDQEPLVKAIYNTIQKETTLNKSNVEHYFALSALFVQHTLNQNIQNDEKDLFAQSDKRESEDIEIEEDGAQQAFRKILGRISSAFASDQDLEEDRERVSSQIEALENSKEEEEEGVERLGKLQKDLKKIDSLSRLKKELTNDQSREELVADLSRDERNSPVSQILMELELLEPPTVEQLATCVSVLLIRDRQNCIKEKKPFENFNVLKEAMRHLPSPTKEDFIKYLSIPIIGVKEIGEKENFNKLSKDLQKIKINKGAFESLESPISRAIFDVFQPTPEEFKQYASILLAKEYVELMKIHQETKKELLDSSSNEFKKNIDRSLIELLKLSKKEEFSKYLTVLFTGLGGISHLFSRQYIFELLLKNLFPDSASALAWVGSSLFVFGEAILHYDVQQEYMKSWFNTFSISHLVDFRGLRKTVGGFAFFNGGLFGIATTMAAITKFQDMSVPVLLQVLCAVPGFISDQGYVYDYVNETSNDLITAAATMREGTTISFANKMNAIARQMRKITCGYDLGLGEPDIVWKRACCHDWSNRLIKFLNQASLETIENLYQKTQYAD